MLDLLQFADAVFAPFAEHPVVHKAEIYRELPIEGFQRFFDDLFILAADRDGVFASVMKRGFFSGQITEERDVFVYAALSAEKGFHQHGAADRAVSRIALYPAKQFCPAGVCYGKHVFIRPAFLRDVRDVDPAVFFQFLEFAVDLAGLGDPEMAQGVAEYGHDFITGHVAVVQ